MTPVEALQILYSTVRSISLSADDHDKLRRAAEILDKIISPENPTKAVPEKSK